MLIAYCQRFAPPPRLIIPPAFEVHCPHFVSRLSSSPAVQPTSLRRCPPRRPLLGQSRSLQHPLETALARCLSVKAQIQFPDLSRTPPWMRFFQTHHLTYLPLSQCSRTAPRSARFFPHPGYPPTQKPLSPLVACSCRDPIFPAQRSKVLTPQRFQSKLDSLFHRLTFLPWHAEVFTSHHHQKCYLCPEPIVYTMS